MYTSHGSQKLVFKAANHHLCLECNCANAENALVVKRRRQHYSFCTYDH